MLAAVTSLPISDDALATLTAKARLRREIAKEQKQRREEELALTSATPLSLYRAYMPEGPRTLKHPLPSPACEPSSSGGLFGRLFDDLSRSPSPLLPQADVTTAPTVTTNSDGGDLLPAAQAPVIPNPAEPDLDQGPPATPAHTIISIDDDPGADSDSVSEYMEAGPSTLAPRSPVPRRACAELPKPMSPKKPWIPAMDVNDIPRNPFAGSDGPDIV